MDRSYGSTDPAIANLDATARILLTTVTHKLVPALAAAKTAVEKSGTVEDINWSDTLVSSVVQSTFINISTTCLISCIILAYYLHNTCLLLAYIDLCVQNNFATSAKQIDHLWQEIQPGGASGNADSGFDMSIVTPIDSGHPTAEQLLQHQQMLERGNMAKGEAVFVGEPLGTQIH